MIAIVPCGKIEALVIFVISSTDLRASYNVRNGFGGYLIIMNCDIDSLAENADFFYKVHGFYFNGES